MTTVDSKLPSDRVQQERKKKLTIPLQALYELHKLVLVCVCGLLLLGPKRKEKKNICANLSYTKSWIPFYASLGVLASLQNSIHSEERMLKLLAQASREI